MIKYKKNMILIMACIVCLSAVFVFSGCSGDTKKDEPAGNAATTTAATEIGAQPTPLAASPETQATPPAAEAMPTTPTTAAVATAPAVQAVTTATPADAKYEGKGDITLSLTTTNGKNPLKKVTVAIVNKAAVEIEKDKAYTYKKDSDKLVLLDSYLKTLPEGKAVVTLEMTTGQNPIVMVSVAKREATLSPRKFTVKGTKDYTVKFDPGTDKLKKIVLTQLSDDGKKHIDAKTLKEGKQYKIDGTTVTFLKSFIKSLPNCDNFLTFNLDKGKSMTVLVRYTSSNPPKKEGKDAKINPTDLELNGTEKSVVVTLNPGSYKLKGLFWYTPTDDDNMKATKLKKGKDYKVKGKKITLTKTFLDKIQDEFTFISFNMSGGILPSLHIQMTRGGEGIPEGSIPEESIPEESNPAE